MRVALRPLVVWEDGSWGGDRKRDDQKIGCMPGVRNWLSGTTMSQDKTPRHQRILKFGLPGPDKGIFIKVRK